MMPRSDFTTLQDSSLKYELRDLISEDSRTKTYHAWDNELSRLVICVCLKKRVGDKGGREFLLHARMLGQLKHPGLLPIHDMGVMKSSYFYCYRPPPGKTLLSLMKGESEENHLEAKSKQLILMLNQIADTISYLHEEGVTLGKLDLDTVSIGRYGEVIITDWTKSKKNDPIKERDQLNIRIQDDLKLLSSLGLSMWFLDPKYTRLNIREWDAVARKLPLELQIVFDRAHLGRGGIYRTARAFQKDINNYFIGKAPVSESNDISFYLKGKYHSHRKAFFLSFTLIVGCIIALLSQVQPLSKLEDERTELSYKQEVEFVDFDPITEELKLLKYNFQRDKEDQEHLKDQLSALNKVVKEADNETTKLTSNLETFQKTEAEYKKDLEKLRAKRRKLYDKKEQLENKIATSKLENPNTQIDIPKLAWVDLSEIFENKKRKASNITSSLSSYAESLDNSESWFYEYLKNINTSPHLLQTIDFDFSETNYQISSNGQKVLWINDSTLIILTLIDQPSWKVIHLEEEFIARSAVFESDSDYIQVLGSKEQVYRINIANRTPGWSRPYLWRSSFKELLPYSSSQNFQIRSFKPGLFIYSYLKNAGENSPSIFEVEEEITPKNINALVVSKQGLIFRQVGHDLYSHFNGPHYTTLPKNLIDVDFTPNDKSLSVLSESNLEIFHPAPTSIALGGNTIGATNKLVSLGKWNFQSGKKPLKLLPIPETSSYWVQFTNNQIYKWNISDSKGMLYPYIIGSPLIANKDTLLTIHKQKLYHYQFTEKSVTDIFRPTSNTLPDNVEELNFEDEPDTYGQTIGKTWSLENDPYYISLSEGAIEVWHRTKRIKVAVIAHSPRALSKVAYSNQDKKIYAIDERGELLSY